MTHPTPDQRPVNRSSTTADSDRPPRVLPDGGRKYVNPTGDHYLTTLCVPVRGSIRVQGQHGLEFSDDGEYLTFREGARIIVTGHHDVTGEVLDRRAVGQSGHVIINSTELDALDAEPGDKVRVYDRPDGQLTVVHAGDDPFVEDGGGR